MLRRVVLRPLSCRCLVPSCFAFVSVLVLSYLLRVVFLLRCAACLSSWVDLSTHFCWFGVVLGVDVGHFGSSWGALGRILDGLEASWTVLGSSCARKTVQLSDAPFWPATWVDFWTVLGAQEGAQTTQDDTLRPQDAPRGRQDGAQDDQKSMIKSN